MALTGVTVRAAINVWKTKRNTKKEHRMISWLNWGDEITTETIRKERFELYQRELDCHKQLVLSEGLGTLAMVEAFKRIRKELSNALVILASPLGRI
jgi:hypothetical protein